MGALPLLSYTPDDMWTQMLRRGDGTLRLPAESFDLAGVLVDRANTFLKTHPDAALALQRVLTLRCATVREDGEPTKRRAARAEFTEQEWNLVSELADYPNRLLVAVTTEAGETYAEVAHESIFRHWQKLRQWVIAEQSFLSWRKRFEQQRQFWRLAPVDSKDRALLMVLYLEQAQQWAEKRANDLSPDDQNFIHLSIEQSFLSWRKRFENQRQDWETRAHPPTE